MGFLKQLTTRGNPLENPAISLGSLANPGAWILNWGGGEPTEAGVTVTPYTALEVAAVVSCVRLISEGIAQLPLRVMERLPRGYRVATDHGYYDLLRNEWNPEMSACVSQTVSLVHALLWGASYTEIQRDNGGRVVALWPRHPSNMAVKRDATGVLFYECTDSGGNGHPRRIEASDMLFVPGLSLDGLTGQPTITYARQTIGIALALDKHASRYFGNGINTTGSIEVPGQLSDKAFSRMKESMERQVSGANRFRALILEAGVKFNAINNQNDQGQFVQTRQSIEEAVCSIFRCPVYLVNSSAGKGVRSNTSEIAEGFLTFSLQPWLQKYSQEFNRKIFSSIGRNAGKFEVQYHTKALMSADATARMLYYVSGRNCGILTANECRVDEGLEPVGPEGDVLISPLNFIPASQLLAEQTIPDPLAVTADEDEDRAHPLPQNLVTRISGAYTPLLTDAFARLNNRSDRNSTSISHCLKPSLDAASSSLRDMLATQNGIEIKDDASSKAIDKYLSSVEAKSGDSTEVSITRAIRALTYSAYQDLASAQASKQIEASHEPVIQ